MAGTEVEIGAYGGSGGNFSSTTIGPTSSNHSDAELDKEEGAGGGGGGGGLFSTSQVLLWVPHATIALLLIGLVAASFVRFHSKHGHKYRKTSAPTGVAREAPATAWMQDNAVVDMHVLDGQSPVSDPPGGTTPKQTLSLSNPPLDPLDDEAGAVQIEWWDSSAASGEPPDRVSESSVRLQSSSGVLCNPVESSGRRGTAGGEAPRALFSVWTLRRGRVGDIVCLPKAISKPLRVSAGDCTTDECHELLLEKL